MANFLNEIIESTIQPVKTNVLWIKNGVPYYYNKRWKPLLGGASGGTVDSPITFGGGEYSAILNYSNNNTLGSRSIALGYNTTSYNDYEASFGKYNKSVKSEDLTKATLFSVGNGNATFPKNALEIKWDGSIYISGIDKSVQDYLGSIKTYDSEINDILKSLEELSDRITITDSKFEEFEEGINTELEEYYSKLTQTAKEIRAEVGSITTELDGRITENTALISITAKEIRSEVSEITTDLDGRIETNKSSISQTAEEIRAEVSRVQTDLSGRIDTANSTISQTADAIRLEVEAVEGELNGKIEKNTSLINQTAESIGLEVTNLSDHLNDVNSELAGLIAENKAAIEINANEIKNKVSSDTFNVFSGEVQNQFTEISTTVEGVKTSVQNIDGKLTEVNATVNGVTTRLGTAEADIESLKKQSDGSIDTHFGTEAPTLNNEPAVNWVTDDLKNEHTGDIYYNNNTGEAYRFSYNPETNEYFWIELTDSALTEALDKISKLESAVDGKVTIFYTTPTNYKYGDMWFVHEDNASFKKGTLVSATNLDKDIIRATLVLADWKEEIEYVNFDELTEELTSLNDYIDNAFKDGVLSEAEIKHIQELKKNFQLSYKEINDLNSFLIITAFATEENKTALNKAKKALDTAFNELIDAIDNLNTELDEDGNNPSLALYNAKYQAYLKALDDYTEIAVLIQSEAEQELLKPSDYIKQISSDGYLTPIEKKQLIAVWKQIAEEFTANRGIAFNYKLLKKEGNNYIDRTDIYDVDTGYHIIYNNYKNSYEAIASIFTDEADPFGFKDLQNTTILSETTIESLASIEQLFDTYYANLALFSEMISKISNDITDAHQKVIDVTNALVDQLDPREAITQIGTGVVLSSVLGVKDINGNLEAALNGSDSIEEAQSTKHGNHGKIVFAGGINGSSKWDDATTIIYEDGHVVINSGEISDFVSIGNATFKNVVEAVTQFDVISSPHVNPDTGEIEYIPLFQVNRNDAGEIIYVSSVYDFVGNREISALGFNAGGGSSGGGLISKVYNVNNFGNITDATNTATFNAYAIDSLYKRIVLLENKEVDLTGYATETWVLAKNYITSTALSPYLKTADANSTFATLVALNALSGNVGSLEGDVSTLSSNLNTLKGRFDALDDTLNDDVSGKINTWNEIVDFLDEYNGSEDLATILSGMNADIASRLKSSDFDTWKTDVYSPLAKRVSTAEGNISANATAITNLGKKVTANEGNIAEILKWFAVDSDGNLYTTYNFYSTKEISSNGLSIGTGGSGSGLISQVYGTTAFGTIASESNSATFNAYAIDSLYKRIVSLEGKATAVSFVPALTSGKMIGTLSIDGVSTVLYGVDAYSKADADGRYLKLTGGEINGYLSVSHATQSIALGVNSKSTDNVAIRFTGANGNSAYLVYSGNGDEWAVTPPNWAGSRILLHSNNYSQYALPLSGGTIVGNGALKLEGSGFSFAEYYSGNTLLGRIGYSGVDVPAVRLADGWYEILHANNYSQYALPLTGGSISGGVGALSIKRTSSNAVSLVKYENNDGALGYLGISKDKKPIWYNQDLSDFGYLYHSGNFNPANYLPLSGGKRTITSTDNTSLVLKTDGYHSLIQLDNNHGNSVSFGYYSGRGAEMQNGSNYLAIKDDGTPVYNTNTLIHSGNIGDYALKTDGSNVMKAGVKFEAVNIDLNVAKGDGIRLIERSAANAPSNTTYWNTFSAISGRGGFQIAHYPANVDNWLYTRCYDAASNAWTSWKTIAFTDSNVASADVIAKTYKNESINYKAESRVRMISLTASNSVDLGAPKRYVSGLSVMSDYVGWQLVSGASEWVNTDFYIRKLADNGKYLAWKQLAFTDSNVASATKLATARTIWGQSFDGSGNVSGNIQGGKANFTIYGYNSTLASNVNILTHDNNKSLWLGYGMNAEGNATIIAGTGIEFRYGASRGIAAFINSSGNVGIGTSAPEHKLHVNGNVAAIATDTTPRSFRAINTNGAISLLTSTSRGVYDSTNSRWLIGTDGTNSFLLCGNVGIGKTNPAYKLDVDGSVRIGSTLLDSYGRVLIDYGDTWQTFGEWTGYGTAIRGSRINFETDGNKRLFINSSGNVTIGSSDLAGTNATLAVKNILRVNDASMNAILNIANEGGTINYVHLFVSSANSSNATTRPLVLQNGYGNVGIGINNPQYKLHVDGTARVSGDVSMGSTLIVTGATTMNSTLTVNGAVTMSSTLSVNSFLNVGTVINVGSNIMPKTNETSYLGSTSLRFLAVCAKIGDFSGAVTMYSTLVVAGISTFEQEVRYNIGIRPNANDTRYVGTSSYRFNEGYINNMYTNAMYVGKGMTYGFKSDGSINATAITANSGVRVASGQAITFLDASGKEHKLTYDSTAGAFKFDGNILVTGDGQFNAIN